MIKQGIPIREHGVSHTDCISYILLMVFFIQPRLTTLCVQVRMRTEEWHEGCGLKQVKKLSRSQMEHHFTATRCYDIN